MKTLTEKQQYVAIEEAKSTLAKAGYFTESLWSVRDVTDKYNCSDEQAKDILRLSLTNDATMEQIWFSIDEFADLAGLTPINDNENPI